ncbi:MAG: hypothetical protein JWO30_47 [Fibrobacteres bacterium]|nr:hypothetical protein [Fibrobacterota bacterium]
MTKKIGKETEAPAISKNGISLNRPKGRTEAEAKTTRRKPMIISHHTNGATIPAPKAKDGDWSVVKGPKELASPTKAKEKTAKGSRKATLSPLARAIRNAYKNSKAGKQVSDILDRIIAHQAGDPNRNAVRRALAASGIPARQASLVAEAWKARSVAMQSVANVLKDGPGEDRHISALNLVLEMSPIPTPEELSDSVKGTPLEFQIKFIWHYMGAFDNKNKDLTESARKASARRYIADLAQRVPAEYAEAGRAALAKESLPKISDDCPAYLREVFDQAKPETIAKEAGVALDRILPTWGKSLGKAGGFGLLSASGIPEAWHARIHTEANKIKDAREERERNDDQDRRRSQEQPTPKAQAHEAAESFSTTTEEWSDYLKKVFDSASADKIAAAVATAIDKINPDGDALNSFTDRGRILRDAYEALPKAWHQPIFNAYMNLVISKRESEQKAEIERRKIQDVERNLKVLDALKNAPIVGVGDAVIEATGIGDAKPKKGTLGVALLEDQLAAMVTASLAAENMIGESKCPYPVAVVRGLNNATIAIHTSIRALLDGKKEIA